MSIGRKIKQLLKAKKMTQGALAEKTGLTQCYVNYLINEKRDNPSVNSVVKIAKALDVSFFEFFEGVKLEEEEPKKEVEFKDIQIEINHEEESN